MKIKITAPIIMILFLFNINTVNASVVYADYFGTTSETEEFLYAEYPYARYDFLYVDYKSEGSGTILFYENVDGKSTFLSSVDVGAGQGRVNAPSGAISLKLRSNDGKEIYLTFAKTANPLATDVYFETSNGNQNGNNNGNICDCIFNSPHWGEYMGKIDQIIGKIPPPPNWNLVAEIFRDKIVPKLINDLGELLGSAPSLPNTPSMPSGLNPGNLQKPKGKENPNLNGFSANDIKNSAPVIDVREDPTGGWNILDPIGSLPSQEEFKQNIPNEGDMIPPEVPEVDAEAPGAPEETENIAPGAPSEGDNIAPTPPEQENKTPGAPSEGENIAPGAPNEGSNIAPQPPEQENKVPNAPSDGDNFAPYPGNSDGSTAPIPGDTTDNAPIPGGGNWTVPMPGGTSGTAPIPSNNNNTAPTPNF